ALLLWGARAFVLAGAERTPGARAVAAPAARAALAAGLGIDLPGRAGAPRLLPSDGARRRVLARRRGDALAPGAGQPAVAVQAGHPVGTDRRLRARRRAIRKLGRVVTASQRQ